MTANTADTWARDPVADANPDLTRKRQRLSEEAETSPLATDESVVVEALPQDGEEMAADLDVDIDLNGDIAIATFSDHFKLHHSFTNSAIQQLDTVHSKVTGNFYLEPILFDQLAQWLSGHVYSTRSMPNLCDRYFDDLDFFSRLANLSLSILGRSEDLFDNGNVNAYGHDVLGDAFTKFSNAITELSLRFVHYLPDLIDASISRRDSGQVNKTRQRIELLGYVSVLAQTAAVYRAPGLTYFKSQFNYKPKTSAKAFRDTIIADPSALSDLMVLLQKLSQNHREIINSWDTIDAILQITYNMDLGAGKTAEQVMDTTHMYLLPVICDKHPRALPDEFHEFIVKMTNKTLIPLVTKADMTTVAGIYDRYIKSDHDALLPQPTAETPISTMLQDLSGGDSQALVGLITTASTLQALKSFIYSDIMDVRSTGIALLSGRLLELYNAHQKSKEHFEHPVLQYVARFMRTNELTKYIFGPNSHASLVHHSQNIISFLAATTAYTDLETDIIWHACTNSVEAEFVKASFVVLSDLCRYLDLDHLLYLANKYAITPPSKLGKDAVDSLTDLFQKVHIKSGETGDRRHRLATAFISIDIMMRINEADVSPLLAQLRNTARNELSRFTTPAFSADDRVQIYSRCIPNITSGNENATTSIDILIMFLRSPCSQQEAQELLNMLPVDAAVSELARFVDVHRGEGSGTQASLLTAIDLRTDVIIRLIALTNDNLAPDTLSSLYKYALGDLAINNDARDRAWNILVTMANLSPIAQTLLSRFLSQEAKTLPIAFTTTRLVHLFSHSLQKEAQGEAFCHDFSLVLDTVMWKKLVQAAESMSNSAITSLAAESITYMLFHYPAQSNFKEFVVRCHGKFAQQQIESISSDFAALPADDTASQSRLIQKIALLEIVTMKSKERAPVFASALKSDVVLATGPEDELLHCTLQVYGGGHSQPKTYRVQGNSSTTVSELAVSLPDITGATENRIIVGGRAIEPSASGDKPLLEIGVQASGVIFVCPKHTFDSDLEKVLTSPGAVEQEVLRRYNELEKLLDGPDAIAKAAFRFFCKISPPAQARRLVTLSSSTVRDLYPPEHPWRSKYYLHVLYQHLMDFARLGVADEAFVSRGIELLVDLVTDEGRPLDLDICVRAMEVLVAFLQERPPISMTADPIGDPSKFTARLIQVCQAGIQRGHDGPIIRRTLVKWTFKLLQQAIRRQSSIWSCFTNDDRVRKLHALLLFDGDAGLAASVSSQITNLCNDGTLHDEIADFYLQTILAMVPGALVNPDRAAQFFELATAVMVENTPLRKDENRARRLTASLVSTLWAYQHSESVDLPIADMVITGLFRLLAEAIKIVKSFKKPLGLPGLGIKIFGELLFPPHTHTPLRRLVHQQSRRLAYELIRLTCETREDLTGLLAAAMVPLDAAENNPLSKYPGHETWMRPASKCSGLQNLGMTCYVNSLLQQLFANVHFRKFVFDTPVVDTEKQALLCEVQLLFGKMQDDYSPTANTSGLAKLLNIQTDSQEDVHGFYEDFLSRLEANMPDQDSKLALGRFFTGKLISQIKGECGHVSPRTEPFVDLPIIVKNKTSLHESLDEFVQGEPMEGANRYKCLACDEADGGRLVNAVRRSCPEELPDNLAFCLKRFTFEAMLGMDGKVNDRFEFPQAIDMSRYLCTSLENPDAKIDEDIFELVGVIVHSGTLQYGHYWSYTLLRNTADPRSRVWVKLEDKNVSFCEGGIEEIKRECFGGQRYSNGNERADNAYVLFYQRKESLEEQLSDAGHVVDPFTQSVLPPKVRLPARVGDTILEHNAWHFHIAHLFDDDFSSFMEWLPSVFKQHAMPSTAQSDASSEEDETPQEVARRISDTSDADTIVQQMSEVAAVYIQRVAVCDSEPLKKLDPCVSSLMAFLADNWRFAFHILDQFTLHTHWLLAMMSHDNKSVRSRITNLIQTCMTSVREHHPTFYTSIFKRLRHICAPALGIGFNLTGFDFEDYLKFIAALAKPGPNETAAILDDGYWMWAFELLALPWDLNARKRFPGLAEYLKARPERFSALYEFIYTLLDDNITVPDLQECSPADGPHISLYNGVLLRPAELACLATRVGHPVFNWIRSSRFAERDIAWEESYPGKLLGLLIEDKVPTELRDEIIESLTKHVDVEEESLASLLHLVIHFCRSTETEQDAMPVWQTLVKVIGMWNGSEGEFLSIIRDAFKSVPGCVTSTVDIWTSDCLIHKQLRIREATEKWLRDDIFTPETIDDLDCDGTRPRQARKLVVNFMTTLKRAYNEEKSRMRYESMIMVLKDIEEYLTNLRHSVRECLASQDSAGRKQIPAALLAEFDESQTTMNGLAQLDEILRDWEPEPLLPAAPSDVRRSVEANSDLDSEEDDDWADDESVITN